LKYAGLIIHEIEFEYVRSRGPGGQHVNRTNSAALLRWNVGDSQVFGLEEKDQIYHRLENVVTKDGDLIVRSEEFRDQAQNRQRALEKLDSLLEQAFFTPKKRYKTKPTRASKVKRYEQKTRRGQVKKQRSKVQSWD